MKFETKEEVFDFLKLYKEKFWDRQFCMNKATSLRGIDYSKEPGGSSNPNAPSIIEKFTAKAIEDEKKMNEIENFIVDNFKGQALGIIWSHYVDFKDYETIASELEIHVDTVYKIQRKGIERYLKNG